MAIKGHQTSAPLSLISSNLSELGFGEKVENHFTTLQGQGAITCREVFPQGEGNTATDLATY